MYNNVDLNPAVIELWTDTIYVRRSLIRRVVIVNSIIVFPVRFKTISITFRVNVLQRH